MAKQRARPQPAKPQPLPPPGEPLTIDVLQPDQDNANKSNERGAGLLESTLRKRGFARSIVIDKDRKVIAGNQILNAASNAGIVRLRIIQTDGNEVIAVQRTDVSLDSKAGRELALSDNISALRSITLDGDVIARQAEEFDIDLDEVGMTAKELKKLIASAEDEDDGSLDGLQLGDEKWMVVVTCKGEADQVAFIEQMQKDGRQCRALLG
jgi:hypothetical protein